MIAGGLYYAGGPSIVWFWPILVAIACTLAAVRVRRKQLDARLARLLTVAALAGTIVAAVGRDLHGRPGVTVFQILTLAVLLLFVLWAFRQLLLFRETYATFFAVACVAIWEGVNLLPTLWNGFVLAAVPAFAARAACVVGLGCGVGLLIVSSRRVVSSDDGDLEEDEQAPVRNVGVGPEPPPEAWRDLDLGPRRYRSPVMAQGHDRRAMGRGVAQVALVPAAALLVHQLRYWLAFGEGANAELARQGHSYLHSIVPWIMLGIGLGVGTFLYGLGRALRGHTSGPRYSLSLGGLWLTCSACLLAIYVGQELLEGWLTAGHPVGLAGIVGSGGWWSIPAALCVGLVLAVVYHGARWVLDELAQRVHSADLPTPTGRRAAPRISDLVVLRLSPLAEGWSGRGPPC